MFIRNLIPYTKNPALPDLYTSFFTHILNHELKYQFVSCDLSPRLQTSAILVTSADYKNLFMVQKQFTTAFSVLSSVPPKQWIEKKNIVLAMAELMR